MNPKFVSKKFNRPELQSCFMVVDDNNDILNVMRAVLARISDMPAEYFTSPTEALAAFQVAPQKFALVITDFDMPEMTGVELCHQLRNISPAVKVLLATGSGIASRSALGSKGFCGLLRKPFTIKDVEDALTNAGIKETQAGNLFDKEPTGLMLA